jgi:hypothetical protein
MAALLAVTHTSFKLLPRRKSDAKEFTAAVHHDKYSRYRNSLIPKPIMEHHEEGEEMKGSLIQRGRWVKVKVARD